MRRTRGFTLIEMIVVIGIMMMMMAMLLPAVALQQKKSDLYATVNVLQVVHDTQMRNARQFGSAGLVYGYTVLGSRAGVRPWIRTGAGVANVDRGDIGKQMFWKVSGVVQFIEFVDLVEPKSGSDFVVSFEPRTGLPYIGAVEKTLAEVTDPAVAPADASFDLRSKRAPNPTVYEITINRTGAIDVHGKR